MNKTDYNRFEITYLTDNIKFADQKAGLLIGLDGLLLKAAIEFFHSAGDELESLSGYSASIGHFSVLAGPGFLIVGIILSLAVVFPRRGSAAKKGFVFWESIVQYPSAGEYVQDVMNAADDELDRKMAEQQYYVSMTATKKYKMLRRAFWASSLGALFITVTAFMLK
jgi:hypothetical protein